jgi:hypothetical protein
LTRKLSFDTWRANLTEPIQFEAIKTALKQSKEGYVLTLAMHPDDIPDDLMRDFVGSRYVVVMVRLGDDEMPMVRDDEFPGDMAVKLAGMLCRDKEFWTWLNRKGWLEDCNESACSEWLCEYLDIESRKELKTNTEARNLFNQLRSSFEHWRKE